MPTPVFTLQAFLLQEIMKAIVQFCTLYPPHIGDQGLSKAGLHKNLKGQPPPRGEYLSWRLTRGQQKEGLNT